MKKIKTIKGEGYRNTAGAYFEKDAESMEGYYHFCDGYRRECLPEMWHHDIHTWIIIRDKQDGTPIQDIEIGFCPICGKSLD